MPFPVARQAVPSTKVGASATGMSAKGRSMARAIDGGRTAQPRPTDTNDTTAASSLVSMSRRGRAAWPSNAWSRQRRSAVRSEVTMNGSWTTSASRTDGRFASG